MTLSNVAYEPDGEPTVEVRGQATFADLYAEHHDRLVRLAYLIIGSAPAAEDLVQDAFAKLHERSGEVRRPAAWLRAVVANAAKNEVRRQVNRRRLLVRLGAERVVDPPAEPTDMLRALAQLTARQRAVVVLRYYEDLPESEIAALLRIRPGTVKSSLHRALQALRAELDAAPPEQLATVDGVSAAANTKGDDR